MVGVQKKDSEHLDGAFYYPKNGYGSIFEAMKKFIGKDHIKLKSKVTAIHHDGNSISGISLDNNQLINTSNVISTLPLNILIDVLRPAPPKNIIDDVKKLQFRFIRLGVISLNMEYFSSNASIYFPEKKFPFTRIYEPKNRSKMKKHVKFFRTKLRFNIIKNQNFINVM